MVVSWLSARSESFVLAEADRALDAAKRGGRDRIGHGTLRMTV